MDPITFAAVASVVGAALFFGAGYAFAPRPSIAPDATETQALSNVSTADSVLAPSRAQPLGRLLTIAAEHTQCRAIAVFDDEGLLIEGNDPDLTLGAAVGTMAQAVDGASKLLVESSAPREMTLGNVSLRPLRLREATMWLATLAGNEERPLGEGDMTIIAQVLERGMVPVMVPVAG